MPGIGSDDKQSDTDDLHDHEIAQATVHTNGNDGGSAKDEDQQTAKGECLAEGIA